MTLVVIALALFVFAVLLTADLRRARGGPRCR